MKIYSMLNAHLERYYQKPVLLETSVVIRSSIFAWMLRLRSNANYYVGYIDDLKTNRARFSHFISIDTNESNYHLSGRQQQSQPPTLQQQSSIDGEPPTTISIKRSCKILIDCLMNENDWSVMQLVLKGLPLILQNKALFRGVDMETLAAAIIGLVAKVRKTRKKNQNSENYQLIVFELFPHTVTASKSQTTYRYICFDDAEATVVRFSGVSNKYDSRTNTVSSTTQHSNPESNDHMFAAWIARIGKYTACLYSSIHNYAYGNFGIDASTFGRDFIRYEPNVNDTECCCSCFGVFVE